MGNLIAANPLKRILDSLRKPSEMESGDGADLIVGLGNPGPRYANTRHNIGFKVAEAVASEYPGGRERNRFDASIYEVIVDGRKLIVSKPLTMMNRSGQSVAPLASWYDIPVEQILVVYDDLDLPFGRIRLRPSGGSGGHNGVASVIQQLGSPEFARLRVGIGRPVRGSTVDYVLSPFNSEEMAQLPDLVDVCKQAVLTWRESGIESAMNEYNQLKDVLSTK